MKLRPLLPLVMAVFAGVATPSRAEPLVTAVSFRYQGSLNDGAGPATGSYDLSFTLYDAGSNGTGIGSLTNVATVVSNGLFTATLTFPTAFDGTNYWLEIAARTNGNDPFTTLSPRQQLLPTPQAIYAINAGSAATATTAASAHSVSGAGISGTISDAQLSTNVALLNGLNTITATNLSAAISQSLWVAAGNGTGTGGNLTLNAGNAGIPSGGAGGNLNLLAGNAMPSGGSGYGGLGPAGAVNILAGNGYNNVGGNVLLQSGGNSPWTLAPNSFSKVSMQGGTINAGDGAAIDVEGGHNTQYGSPPQYSAGGNVKITAGHATGAYSGGNIILLPGTGSPNGNVGIGKTSPATALDVNGTVTATAFSGNGAGLTNLNLLSGLQSGGAANAQVLTWNGMSWVPSNAPSGGGSVGGGLATSGGSGTNENLYGSTTFNGPMAATNLSAATSQSLWVAAGKGTGNGGHLSLNAGDAGVTSGGAGGNLNLQSGSALPQGGVGYSGQGPAGAVNISAGGGYNGVGGNVIVKSGPNSPWSLTPNGYSKVSLQGGTLNAGDAAIIDVEGGHNPLSNGSSASAGGNVKITAGNAAGAYSGGHILLMPGTGSPGGNVGIGKTSPATALDVNGTVTATAFNPSSDRSLKENFAPVSPRDVLEKVAAMPISRWNFIGDPATPHFGPMAQDFRSAFGLGTDERHIATVDADGVALAAIQGLNQKLNEKDAEIQDLKRSIADLKELVRSLGERK